MRIAVLIFGLLLGILLFLQSVLAYGFAGDDEQGVLAWGVMVALLWLIGCAFVLAIPRVSVIAFVVAGLIAFLIVGSYPDMLTWGIFSLVLAVMSWLGFRGKQREDERREYERERQQQRDRMLEDMLRRQAE